MPERWTLHRAGIINVYQYGDETLHFGGGRLLLRGVNGSGKSTAMNMLLPFLLEADTRRIDAAGEQSGVLRSWMLSGRDEAQPQGYLWIELARDDEHLTFGCGIRANQSTDRVTTWWFITPRRPGIDLALVEQRTPLSVEALRAELGSDGVVYAHDQRAAYRADVRARLYGGADLEQHLRLLHVVRNPRVGDRIDLDLPQYLEDALPQLSEAALDDAAQPLEDLEEHRRNVEDLVRTAATLDALEAVFRNYARAELHRRADHAMHAVERANTQRRTERDAHRKQEDARAAEAEATGRLAEIDANRVRLQVEIDSLRRSDAYQQGQDLDDLRAHVRSLDEQLATAHKALDRRVQHTITVADAVRAAAAECERDHADIRRELTEVGRLATAAGLTARPPDVPPIVTDALPIQLVDDAGATRPDDALARPLAALDPAPIQNGIGAVLADAKVRGAAVAEVRSSLDAVDDAERATTLAEAAVDAATAARDQARTNLADAREHLATEGQGWRDQVRSWWVRLDDHRRAHGLDLAEELPELDRSDLIDGLDELILHTTSAVDHAIEHHLGEEATLGARREEAVTRLGEAEVLVAELDARTLPEPPVASWQRPDGATRLTEVIDFTDHASDIERAGIEAAMEAAGLLGAEVGHDGSLVGDGQLLVVAGPPAARPLGALVTVTVPDTAAPLVDPAGVQRLLDSISLDPDDLHPDDHHPDDLDPSQRSDGPSTVITTDGRFRTGALVGHNRKATAEHIGVTARRANLERQRAEARREVEAARSSLAEVDHDLTACRTRIADARSLRASIPTTDGLVRAHLAAQHQGEVADDAERRHDEATDRQREAEARYAEVADGSRRLASTLGLPPDRAGLRAVDDTIAELVAQCRTTSQSAGGLARAVDRWIGRAHDWSAAADDEAQSRQHHEHLEREHAPLAMKLATLEDSIGLAYEQVVAALGASQRDLDATVDERERAVADERAANQLVGRTAAEHAGAVVALHDAEAQCVTELPVLRAVLAIPGLVSSAERDATTPPSEAPATGVDDMPQEPELEPAATFPTVDESPTGVRALALAIRQRIPTPAATDTTADSVRQSLRQRRDRLGAGWDAEDRQPDEHLPLHIEVNGPLGRMPLAEAVGAVGAQRSRMSALLSAKQDQALRNLLQGLIAREVAEKLHAATELVGRMNRRLDTIATSHGIGASLRWKRRDDLDEATAETVGLLAKPPDLRTVEQDQQLTRALSQRIADARLQDPEAPYRQLIASVLDYRAWHRMTISIRRPGRSDEVLSRRTALSEGEKKMVSYLPLFAAVAASCDALAEGAAAAPRFVLLDDAFAKVSEDNHEKLFGLLVELDLDFIATSERLWGTHASVPELAITEVLRDADLKAIVLEHSRWNGHTRTAVP